MIEPPRDPRIELRAKDEFMFRDKGDAMRKESRKLRLRRGDFNIR
jgi:hypothetical protein